MLPVTELSFLEKFSERFNIPTPRYLSMPASEETIKDRLNEWGGKAIVKPDIPIGKRGKANAIVRVNSIQDVVKEIRRLSVLEIGGKIARTAYLVENIPAIHVLGDRNPERRQDRGGDITEGSLCGSEDLLVR